LVLFLCMWQSSEDAGLSTSPDSWLHLSDGGMSAYDPKRTWAASPSRSAAAYGALHSSGLDKQMFGTG